MRKHEFEYPCGICKDRSKISFTKKPSYFSPGYLEHECVNCDTRFGITIRPQKGVPGKIEIQAQILVLSQHGELLLKAQQAKAGVTP